MVSPDSATLSVFITPWTKPRRIQCATRSNWRRVTVRSISSAVSKPAAVTTFRVSSSDCVAAYCTVPTRRWLLATRTTMPPGTAPF